MDEPLSDADRMELTEFRLAESVEDKVLKRLRQGAIYFAAGLTLLGVVGLPIFYSYVSDRVTSRITEQIEDNNKRLRDQLDSELVTITEQKAEIDVRLKEARSELESAQRQIEVLKSVSHQGQKLSDQARQNARTLATLQRANEASLVRIQDLGKRVDGLTAGVQGALSVAVNSKQSTVSLQTALTSSSLGKPSIFSIPTSILPSGRNTISGVNFGDKQGRVYVRASGWIVPQRYSSSTLFTSEPTAVRWEYISAVITSPIDLGSGVSSWTGHAISYILTDSVQAQLKKEASRLNSGKFSIDLLEYQVETATGSKSEWAYGGSLPF
jgi:hypothetical protein